MAVFVVSLSLTTLSILHLEADVVLQSYTPVVLKKYMTAYLMQFAALSLHLISSSTYFACICASQP